MNHISKGHTVYDPFMGSGTTNIVAKKLGVNSYGVEAHPFIFEIAQAKLEWDIEKEEIITALQNIENYIISCKRDITESSYEIINEEFPELVLKCYEENTLLDLYRLCPKSPVKTLGLDISDVKHSTPSPDLSQSIGSIPHDLCPRISKIGFPFLPLELKTKYCLPKANHHAPLRSNLSYIIK